MLGVLVPHDQDHAPALVRLRGEDLRELVLQPGVALGDLVAADERGLLALIGVVRDDEVVAGGSAVQEVGSQLLVRPDVRDAIRVVEGWRVAGDVVEVGEGVVVGGVQGAVDEGTRGAGAGEGSEEVV